MRLAYVIITARIQLRRNLFLLFSGPLPYNNGIGEQNGIWESRSVGPLKADLSVEQDIKLRDLQIFF
jgi:hypothetical protein